MGTRFDIPLEMISDNGSQFTSDMWEDLMEQSTIKYKFIIMYKLSTNGLVK